MWQLSAALGLALALSLGGFKMYYDAAEAEKQQLRLEIDQAVRNQALLEKTIADQNLAMEGRERNNRLC